MNQDDKSYIHSHVISLMDKIDALRIKGADDELIKLLERALNIGSISVLNYERLTSDELGNVRATLSLCDNLLNPQNEKRIGANCVSLDRVVTAIEELFRNKRLLFDREEEMTI